MSAAKQQFEEQPSQERSLPFADSERLNPEQRRVYDDVLHHYHTRSEQPLHALVLGTAGTGKSFLIHCLRQVLDKCCIVLAPTGVAAINVNGQTIHSFFQFARLSQLNDLRGAALHKLQEKCLSAISYYRRVIYGQQQVTVCY